LAVVYKTTIYQLLTEREDLVPTIDVQLSGIVDPGKILSHKEFIPRLYYRFPEPQSGGSEFEAYELRGDSMNEIYPDGTILMCAPTRASGRRPTIGDHVVLRRTDSSGKVGLELRELRSHEGVTWYWFRSRHPEFQVPVREPLADFELVALVVAAYVQLGSREAHQ
jgi:hypothetical protein